MSDNLRQAQVVSAFEYDNTTSAIQQLAPGFTNIYRGAGAPTLTVENGNLYFDESNNSLYVRAGDAWIRATADVPDVDTNVFLAYADNYVAPQVGGFPTTGGFALENLGQTIGIDGVARWPNTDSTVEGMPGITYSPGPGNGGTITNNTGAAIDLSNGRLDVDVSISSVDQSLTSLDVSFRSQVRAFSRFIITEANPTTLTMTLTDPQGEGVWNDGESFLVFLTARGGGITLNIDAFRLSFTQTPFVNVPAAQESVTNFSLTRLSTSMFLGIAVGSTAPMVSTGGRGYVWTEDARSTGTGQGFALVDSLVENADEGTHQRLNSTGRGYFRGTNSWTQVDGQKSERLIGDFRLENTNGFTGGTAPVWNQHPAYFIIGEFNDN